MLRSRNNTVQSRSESTEPQKSTDQLEIDAKRLEALLEERQREYEELLSKGDAEDNAPTSTVDEMVAEIHELNTRNNKLRKDLKSVADLEKQYASDPRVVSKRNEVRAIRIEAEKYETELATLQTLKKRRDKGLKEINLSEERVKKVKRQENEMKAEAREQIKQLEAELRALSDEDIRAHEQLASLQEKLKVGVSKKELDDLVNRMKDQERVIRELRLEEEEWKQRRSDMQEEGQGNLNRQRRELQKLEEEVERLKKVLVQRENEHKRSYQNNFND